MLEINKKILELSKEIHVFALYLVQNISPPTVPQVQVLCRRGARLEKHQKLIIRTIILYLFLLGQQQHGYVFALIFRRVKICWRIVRHWTLDKFPVPLQKSTLSLPSFVNL